MANNYDINYDDERFTQVENDKQQAINEVDQVYGDMIGQSDKYYQDQIQLTKDWADKQSQLQQDKTDFTIEKIEQQKDQAQKDYTKEQSGAYADWQKQSNQYGVNAEQMAASGLTNTGYSESSQVSMYNTYQNRVITARESYNKAVLNYNNSIKEAQLQNSSILAQIAFEALGKELSLSIEGFQYKNQLLLGQLNAKQAVEDRYYGRWQDVLAQVNQENALAEEIRQFNENMAEEQRQFNEQMSAKKNSSSSGSKSSGKSSSSSGSAKVKNSTKTTAPTLVNPQKGYTSTAGRTAYNSVTNFTKSNTNKTTTTTKNVKKEDETMAEYAQRLKNNRLK